MIGIRSYTYIDRQLVSWGVYKRWLERGSGGHGRSGPAPLRSWWSSMITSRLVQGHGRAAPVVEQCPVNIEEARDMDACVNVLAMIEPDLHQVVMECWYIGGTVEQQVEACGCAIQTYYNRLDRAKARLQDLLNDQAAGLLYLHQQPHRMPGVSA